MTSTVSSWVAHATREPGAALLASMDEWWNQAPLGNDPLRACPWLGSSFHRLITIHVDRAAHKRRHVPEFLCRADCTLEDHGPSPIATMLRDDAYDPAPLRVRHTIERTALGDAIDAAAGTDSALTIAVVEEAEFEDANAFDVHRSALISPQRDGVSVPVIHVPTAGKESLDDEEAREDFLRAAGWATYVVDLKDGEDALQLHARLASCIEDVFDEISQIKADAAARVLLSDPLWPALVVRTTPAWRDEHSLHDGALSSIASAF